MKVEAFMPTTKLAPGGHSIFMFTKATIHKQGVTLYDHRGISRGFNFRADRRLQARRPQARPQSRAGTACPRERRPQDDLELNVCRCYQDGGTVGMAVLPPDFKF
ncbi:MAG: hypothetical protein QOF48_3719 [Verrucomicrobiota bacterium]|jgi:hypothetical protein